MISPKVYRQQVQDLGIEGMIVFAGNADEATIILDNLQNVEKILERIRYNVRIDIRVIRMEYMDKIKTIKDSSKVMGLYNKQRTVKDKIKEKKLLMDERDMRIVPYESIERMIDDYLRQIRDAKAYLTTFSPKYTDEGIDSP